jgi:hypothetical protein
MLEKISYAARWWLDILGRIVAGMVIYILAKLFGLIR